MALRTPTRATRLTAVNKKRFPCADVHGPRFPPVALDTPTATP